MKYNKTSFTITCSEPLKLAVQELLIDAAGELGYESFDEEDGILLQQNLKNKTGTKNGRKMASNPLISITKSSYMMPEIVAIRLLKLLVMMLLRLESRLNKHSEQVHTKRQD